MLAKGKRSCLTNLADTCAVEQFQIFSCVVPVMGNFTICHSFKMKKNVLHGTNSSHLFNDVKTWWT